MYIDSHAHLGSEELFSNCAELLKRALAVGVEVIVNICTDELTLQRGLILKETHPEIFLAASSTPHDGGEAASLFFIEVEKAARAKKLVAIGETGLDYYYEHASKEEQKKYLIKYFHLAKQVDLPIIFHCREAFADLFTFAEAEYSQGQALLHCFTGTLEEAKKVLDLGWFISFSGIATFKKSEALREVIQYVPLDRMMIETDAPYLAPNSKRGKVNEPSFIVETAEMIAKIKQVPLEFVAEHTKKNAVDFFLINNKN
ncbi:MAG: TatD family hydrolase [Chlamydiota bacterium]